VRLSPKGNYAVIEKGGKYYVTGRDLSDDGQEGILYPISDKIHASKEKKVNSLVMLQTVLWLSNDLFAVG
jgi:hypothetical protein